VAARGEATRARLLDAAVLLFAERGLGGVSLREINEAAGQRNTNALHYHFGDRDGLIGAIVERFSTDLLPSVTTPLAADATTLELLRSTVDAYVGFIERETNLYRFMVQHPSDRLDRAGALPSLVDRVAHQIGLLTAERLRLAGRDGRAAVPWAYGIVGLVHQAGDWWVDHQTITREALVRDLVSLLWSGLGTTPIGTDGEA
jgi:AcrR family transcriptional regulator